MSGGYDEIQEDGRLYVPACDRYKHNRLNAKIPKILSHKYTNTEWSVWVDSNITMKCLYIELINIFLEDDANLQVGIFKHPDRNNIEEEIAICSRLSLDDKSRLDYHKGKGSGERLAYCGIIIRRNTDLVAQYNERWWAEISRGSSRDQCSFPYTLGKIATYKKLEPENLFNGKNVHEHNKYYSRCSHNKGNRL